MGCLAAAAPAAEGAGEARSRASFYEQVASGVVRLEHYDVIERAGSDERETVGHTDGTGFFVIHDRALYLVSARHLVEVPFDLQARVPTQLGSGDGVDVLELRLPHEAWVYHPQGNHELADGRRVAAIDVAAVRVPWPKERVVKAVGFCPEPCASGVIDQFAARDPEPPDLALIFGFPLDLGFQLEEQRPMARMGVVAMVAGETFLRRDGVFVDERVLLVDAEMFSGNSGSPMFRYPLADSPFELLGLITGANEGFDYAAAEPVSRIAETLRAAAATAVEAGARHPGWYPFAKRSDAREGAAAR